MDESLTRPVSVALWPLRMALNGMFRLVGHLGLHPLAGIRGCRGPAPYGGALRWACKKPSRIGQKWLNTDSSGVMNVWRGQ